MTTQEAYKEIMQASVMVLSDKKKFEQSLGIAIDALRKQLPLRPFGIIKAPNGPSGKCPSCKCQNLRMPYCQRCGQKLDWSDI